MPEPEHSGPMLEALAEIAMQITEDAHALTILKLPTKGHDREVRFQQLRQAGEDLHALANAMALLERRSSHD